MSKKINVYHLRSMATERKVGERVIKEGGRPYATVAIEINEDGTVNRGVSICSAVDSFVKSIGVKKAIGRLESAKKRKGNIRPIESFESTQKRLLKKMGNLESSFKNTSFKCLGSYCDTPTMDELKMFKKEFEERGC